jgi:hypothetical protein
MNYYIDLRIDNLLNFYFKLMVDNKKIKLPQHLQLDSVSPATRLLEKRRAMYEVQKAFEDQKEEF